MSSATSRRRRPRRPPMPPNSPIPSIGSTTTCLSQTPPTSSLLYTRPERPSPPSSKTSGSAHLVWMRSKYKNALRPPRLQPRPGLQDSPIFRAPSHGRSSGLGTPAIPTPTPTNVSLRRATVRPLTHPPDTGSFCRTARPTRYLGRAHFSETTTTPSPSHGRLLLERPSV